MEGDHGKRRITKFSPILARTTSIHRPIGPMAYDCIKVILIRDGSAVLFSEFGQRRVKVGDVVLLGGSEANLRATSP